MRKGLIFTIIAIIIVLLTAYGCEKSRNNIENSETTTVVEETSESEDVTLIEKETTTEQLTEVETTQALHTTATPNSNKQEYTTKPSNFIVNETTVFYYEENEPEEITEVEEETETETEVIETTTEEPEEEEIVYSCPRLYEPYRFRVLGILSYSGYRWTYYSQRVLPGGGLRIPGRHVDYDGYVCDENGYICLASMHHSRGAIISTPLGKYGCVYDYCETPNTIDVYVDW